jgi:hypothetical protein
MPNRQLGIGRIIAPGTISGFGREFGEHDQAIPLASICHAIARGEWSATGKGADSRGPGASGPVGSGPVGSGPVGSGPVGSGPGGDAEGMFAREDEVEPEGMQHNWGVGGRIAPGALR